MPLDKQKAWGIRVGHVHRESLTALVVLPGVLALNDNRTAHVSAFVHGQIADLSTDGTLLFADNLQGSDLTLNGIPFIGRVAGDDIVDISSPKLQTLLSTTSDEVGTPGFYDNEVPALAPLLAVPLAFGVFGFETPIPSGTR